MVYNRNIPQPNERPSQTQPKLLENFGQLATVFDANHATYDDPTIADRGKHKFVTLQRQTAPPAVTGTDAVFFASKPTIGAQSAPFYRTPERDYSIPIGIYAGNFTLASSSGTKNVLNMTGYPPMTGTVLAIQTNNTDRSLFSSFYWSGTSLSIPGPDGQLIAGNTLQRFDDDGDGVWLQIRKDSTSGSILVSIRFFAMLI